MRALPGAPEVWRGAAALELRGITSDSRKVEPGVLFAAVPGLRHDGRDFIADAVERGAAGVLAPEGTSWPAGVPPRPLLCDPKPRRRLAQIAAQLAGPQPASVVAVTGTNGKTSTVEFVRQLWALSGFPAASLGTLGLIAPGSDGGSGLTTPDPVALAETLAMLARAGVQHAAVEASSHGLDQFRLDGVRLAAAAFTNLTRDHLDYHGTPEAYRAAKLRLFAELLPQGAMAVASTTLDAITMDELRGVAHRRKLRLRTVGEGGDFIHLLRAEASADGQELQIEVDGIRRGLHLKLPGRFQADNALLAASLAMATGSPDALDRLEHLRGVRGRMELATVLPNNSAVYVDYAHTPDALERLLSALRPHAAGRLVVVFGAGGDRDRGKRPLMGAVANRLADRVIVTDDNPRGEDPASIRAAILAAAPGGLEIGDRQAAIAAAMNELRPGDVLAVAGKGHEQGQIVGATTLPFDDATTIRRLATTATTPPAGGTA